MPTITVDGTKIEAKDRQMILQACLDAGMDVPHYCYHPGLSIVASCRICLAEVEGMPKLVPTCQTPVREGMVVHLNSTKSIANQKQVMEYLLINHPLDCPVCDQAGECYLQDYSYKFGRSQSRFEEAKYKKPKKDIGLNVILYNDRCIMCTRCVRFTREVSGTSELFVDGRGAKEEIEIFPGKPLNNNLSGNVVDLCPVGALLDKDFLYKQRVWFLKSVPSVSPADSGGENIWVHHNEGTVYRLKPRYNAGINQWWISDDTRFSHKIVADERRMYGATRTQYGAPIDVDYAEAIAHADTELKRVHAESGDGSLYAVLSPMLATEEAHLLATYVRSIDPQAVLVLGPVPRAPSDEVYTHYLTKQETFRVQAEKVPNRRGIERVIAAAGGPSSTWTEFTAGPQPAVKGGWITGGYHSNWIGADVPAVLKKGVRVVQDMLPTTLSAGADVVLPAAAWVEKSGSWENHAGVIQAFGQAFPPRQGAMPEGDVYARLLNRRYDAAAIRAELGEDMAAVTLPTTTEADEPAMEFVEI
ncbi:MAG TPA: 2Fe-2S iron-sulfur cluster-binding protein [Tepidisphaeraceae bacterium]|jgi:NADH-quinone oxidoreductase subunit G